MLVVESGKLKYSDADCVWVVNIADIEGLSIAKEIMQAQSGIQVSIFGFKIKTKYNTQWITFSAPTLAEVIVVRDQIALALGV